MRRILTRASLISVGMATALATSMVVATAPVSSAASSGSSAAAGPAHTVHPLRAPDGAPLHGTMNQVITSNWSGYAVANYQTGNTYSAAQGTWVVPTVALPSGFTAAYSSSWVGIGGFCENPKCRKVDSTLIQLGTEQDVSSSGSSYSAWYELLPAMPVTITALTIKPGDTVTASLSTGSAAATVATAATRPDAHGGTHGGHGGTTTSTQSWTLTMEVTAPGANSPGQTWSTSVPYASSELSAEWIEESPAGCVGGACFILPLANVGTATFDPGTVNGGANPQLAPSQAIEMVDPSGQTSTPSAPDQDTDGFNACWAAGSTPTSCSPPKS